MNAYMTFSDFFGIWTGLLNLVCLCAIVAVIGLYLTDKDDRKKIKKILPFYGISEKENSFWENILCFFLLVPIIIHHCIVIFGYKRIDALGLILHVGGVFCIDILLILYSKNKIKTQPERHKKPEPNLDSESSDPEEEPEPDFDFTEKDASYTQYGFDPSRFKSKRNKERYEQYSNMANDENASPNERQIAMRKMIEMDRDEN